jgi:hypothetical protein
MFMALTVTTILGVVGIRLPNPHVTFRQEVEARATAEMGHKRNQTTGAKGTANAHKHVIVEAASALAEINRLTADLLSQIVVWFNQVHRLQIARDAALAMEPILLQRAQKANNTDAANADQRREALEKANAEREEKALKRAKDKSAQKNALVAVAFPDRYVTPTLSLRSL